MSPFEFPIEVSATETLKNSFSVFIERDLFQLEHDQNYVKKIKIVFYKKLHDSRCRITICVRAYYFASVQFDIATP